MIKQFGTRLNALEKQYSTIRQHLFEVSRLHSAYTSKMGYRGNSVTQCFIWSQRAELNRRPTDYESLGQCIPTDSYIFINIDKIKIICNNDVHRVMRKYLDIHLIPNPRITPEKYEQKYKLHENKPHSPSFTSCRETRDVSRP